MEVLLGICASQKNNFFFEFKWLEYIGFSEESIYKMRSNLMVLRASVDKLMYLSDQEKRFQHFCRSQQSKL